MFYLYTTADCLNVFLIFMKDKLWTCLIIAKVRIKLTFLLMTLNCCE